MKPKTELPTVPLNEEEKFHLQTIYGTRLRNIGAVYLFLIIAGLYAGIAGFAKSNSTHKSYRKYSAAYKAYDYEVAGVVLTKQETAILGVCLLEAIIMGSCIVLFFKRVRPFKKDAKLGVKEVVSYTIVKKRYFEHTGQCFFSLNDPNYMHHEVDADTFNSFNEGDTVQVYRGVYSGYVFQKDARFSFM